MIYKHFGKDGRKTIFANVVSFLSKAKNDGLS